VIRYDLGRPDAELLVRGIARAAELQLAAGAHTVHVPIRDAGPLHTVAEARALTARRVHPADLGLTAFHPLGTARAGAVVDADLHVGEVAGLAVADGSVVPAALGVNPQLTIMTLATRMAFALLGRPAPEDEPRSESVGRASAAVPVPA
jgi:choline dehydrogenase-like flavoprotein